MSHQLIRASLGAVHRTPAAPRKDEQKLQKGPPGVERVMAAKWMTLSRGARAGSRRCWQTAAGGDGGHEGWEGGEETYPAGIPSRVRL